MHLDGVLGQAQFGGDLFVQQAIGQAQQHAELLGRELREAGGQFGVGFGAFGRHGGEPSATVEYRLDGIAHGLGRSGLGDEARRAKLLRAADDAGVVVGRDDDHGQLVLFAAQMQPDI